MTCLCTVYLTCECDFAQEDLLNELAELEELEADELLVTPTAGHETVSLPNLPAAPNSVFSFPAVPTAPLKVCLD